MNTRIYILICLGLLYLFPGLKAQIPNSPTTALTPNAAAISRYGEIPVSLYTGTPEISIPLYVIQGGGLSLPINLSYHSGGVKPDEHSGWVGMGWSLQAGGVITRKKNDMIDEYTTQSMTNFGYYYKHSLTSETAGWDNPGSNFWKLMLPFEGIGYLFDTQPDEFNFNFCGYSGTFLLDSNGEWQVRCDRPVKITHNGFEPVPFPKNSVHMSHSFSGFTLTTEDGVVYVFGNGAIEYSIDFTFQNTSEWEATSWSLKQIIHPNGDTIEFDYKRGEYISWLSSTVNSMMYNISIDEHFGLFGLMRNKIRFFGGTNNSIRYMGNLLSPVYLKSIKTVKEKVLFNSMPSDELGYPYKAYESIYRQTGSNLRYLMDKDSKGLDDAIKKIVWYRLNSIVINDNMSQKTRSVDFNFGNNKSQRLMLESICMSGLMNIPEDRYLFRYSNFDRLPPYLNRQIDHWGFFNNRPLGGVNDDYLDKEVNPEVLVYGSLSEIIYPTGGKTLFEFEPHSYSQQVRIQRWQGCEPTGLCVAGGLRVKKITNVPHNGQPPVVKEYFYQSGYSPDRIIDDNNSSGILGGQAVYLKVTNAEVTGSTNEFNYEVDVFYAEASSSSIAAPCANTFGYHVGYSEVIEKNGDGSYSIEHFANFDQEEFLDEQWIVSFESNIDTPCSSRAAYRGKQMWRKDYNALGELQKETSIIYEKSSGCQFVRSLYCHPIFLDNESGSSVVSIVNGTVSKIFTYTLLKKEEKIMEFGDKSTVPLETKIVYEYNLKNMLSSREVQTSYANTPVNEITSYSYTWERNAAFLNQYLLSQVDEISVEKNGLQEERTQNVYELLNGKYPILVKVFFSKKDYVPELRYQCHLYDSKGNPVWVSRNMGEEVIYLWGHEGRCLIAEIRNATASQVEQVLGINLERSSDYQIWVERRFDVLRDSLPQALITTYTYLESVGVTSVTDPSGKTQTYLYDDYGRLAETIGPDSCTLAKFQYVLESGSGELSDEEREQLRNQHIREWAEGILVKGTCIIPPGESRTFHVDIERFPCAYRWRIEGNMEDVAYTTEENYIRIQNLKSVGEESSLISVFMDFLKDGEVLASSSGTNVDLNSPLLNIEVYVDSYSIGENTVQLKITVSPSVADYPLDEVWLKIDGKDVDRQTPPEILGDRVFFWCTLKIKSKGEYYDITAIDNSGATTSTEVSIFDLFPIKISNE